MLCEVTHPTNVVISLCQNSAPFLLAMQSQATFLTSLKPFMKENNNSYLARLKFKWDKQL